MGTGAAMGAGGNVLRPFGDEARQLARLVVVTTEGALGSDPRRAKKDDGVVNQLAAKDAQWLEIFGQDANRTTLVTVEELFVFVSEKLPTHFGRFGSTSIVHDAAT